MTPDTPVWIAAARAGAAFHEITDDGRRTRCGRFIGSPDYVLRGYVQPLAEVVQRFGSGPCRSCGGASVPPRVVPSRDRQAALALVQRLEAVRVQRGISRRDLAYFAGLGTATVERALKTGKAQLFTILAIARVLGLDLRAIMPPPPSIDGRPPCGTIAAARRHYYHHEPLDEWCRAAQRKYDRDRKRAIYVAQREADGREPPKWRTADVQYEDMWEVA